MKNPKTGIFCLLLTCCYIVSSAQNLPINEPNNHKPSLFHDLPDHVNAGIADLESLLTLQVGQSCNTIIAPGFVFQGEVISISDAQDENVKSVVIKSTNHQGARLTFTRVTINDGTVNYVGRILSREHSDGFEISFENGQYYFIKKGFNDLVSE